MACNCSYLGGIYRSDLLSSLCWSATVDAEAFFSGSVVARTYYISPGFLSFLFLAALFRNEAELCTSLLHE